MLPDSFTDFPDDARLWIYGADRPLSEDEQAAVVDTLDTFMADWMSHGRSVEGAAAIVDDRFLLIAAYVRGGDISGCGIDSSTDVIANVADRLDIEWLPALNIFYRDAAGDVHGIPRPAFRAKVDEGTVTRETPVYDLSLETLGDLREDGFERPAGESWHALVFRIPEAA